MTAAWLGAALLGIASSATVASSLLATGCSAESAPGSSAASSAAAKAEGKESPAADLFFDGDRKPTATAAASAAVPPSAPMSVPLLDPQEQARRSGGPTAAIDPNGRFATTYRPGAGHLAAFESAVARGVVPATDREIVSDLGARYAPKLESPAHHAMAFRADFERSSLPPEGGEYHVRLTLQSTDQQAVVRPRLAVAIVLDVSGSMAGPKIDSARKAATQLVEKLGPEDSFSLVTFSNSAHLVVPMESVGPHRAQIERAISGVEPNGGTNLGEGLRLGYQQTHDDAAGDGTEKVVFLLSDGRANAGITSQSDLSRLALSAFQDRVQTSTFGLGTDFDGSLMSSIADSGAGGYYFLRGPEQIPEAVATELNKRLDPVASALEVRVQLKPSIQLVDAYGSRRLTDEESRTVRTVELAVDKQAVERDHIRSDRARDQEGGMRFFIPAFARSDTHSILLKLRLPAGTSASEVGMVQLRYKDRVFGENVQEDIPLDVSYASDDSASRRTIDGSVARTIQGFQAGEALLEAANDINMGDRMAAKRVLAERRMLLGEAASNLDEPLFKNDADRFAALEAEVDDRTRDPLLVAMISETAAHSHMR